jgi:ribosome-associated heat shock protein Hsp15
VNDDSEDEFRLDKWLWAARFFKTRSLAADAIDGGRVELNGERAKRARRVKVGDILRIRFPPYEHLITVRALTHHRGPASVAITLYEEDPASRRNRELLAIQMKAVRPDFQHDKGKPSKQERRNLLRLKRKN